MMLPSTQKEVLFEFMLLFLQRLMVPCQAYISVERFVEIVND